MGGRVKSGIKLKIFFSDTMLNYRLSQKFKLLGNDEFNHLIIILTHLIKKYKKIWQERERDLILQLNNGSSGLGCEVWSLWSAISLLTQAQPESWSVAFLSNYL